MKNIRFYIGIILVVIIFSTGIASADFYFKEIITEWVTVRLTKDFDEDHDDGWSIDTLQGNSEFGTETNLISYYHSIRDIDPPLLPDGLIKQARLKIFLRSNSSEDITLTVDGIEYEHINSRHFLVKMINGNFRDDDHNGCGGDVDDYVNVMETLLGDSVIQVVLSNPNETFKIYGSVMDICYKPSITLDINESNDILPLEYLLKTNYPNPFNPSTTIEYNLPKYSYVEIIIYNLLGQEIKKLVNESIPAGQHAVVWDGTDNYGNTVSTGLYLYRINTNSFSESKKMILLK